MNRKIGICDSGLGGILVMKALMDANPNVDFVYIGDQAHAPYGDRTKDELQKYGSNMIREFQRQGINEVIIACNTLCANVFEELCFAFPDIHLSGVLKPTVSQLAGKNIHSVLVLATAKTIASHAFEKAIHDLDKACQVYEQACPALVPLIEEGNDMNALKAAAIDYVKSYKGKVEAVILGCTHFPLIKEVVKEQLDVLIFDSNQAAVSMMNLEEGERTGNILVYTTKDAAVMKQQIKRIIHKDLEVQKINFED